MKPTRGGTFLYCPYFRKTGPGNFEGCWNGHERGGPWRTRIARGGLARFRRHWRRQHARG